MSLLIKNTLFVSCCTRYLTKRSTAKSLQQWCRYTSSLSSLTNSQTVKIGKANFYIKTVEKKFYSSEGWEHKKGEKMPLWQRVAIVAGIVGLGYISMTEIDGQKELNEEKVRYEELNVKTPLGGEWELIDDEGRKRNSREFNGQWMLIYFGFSHCPDICPEEMEKMKKIVQKIDKEGNIPNLLPVFITLDPERDTPKVIKDYLKGFDIPRVVGFTAETVDEIRTVSKKFRVYFGKGEADEDNDYIIDHTIILYLVNSEGKFVNFFGRGLDAEPIIESIKKHMELYQKLKRKRMM